jgi:hypothetical protein
MRNRDHRGRFRGNSKQKKEETSTQKSIETNTRTLAEETIKKNIELGNTTYQQIQILGDPNSVDTVNPEEVQAIFRNLDTVVSQITITTIESKVIGSSKEPIGDSNSIKKNPERWDFTPSPKKDQIAYTIFGDPFNMTERGRELDRRERGEIHVENEE